MPPARVTLGAYGLPVADAVGGARSFLVSGQAYDLFMGRYSRELAPAFADAAGIAAGQDVLDVGCGPGALTGELVRRTGADRVLAVDPSPPFVEACAQRYAGVQVRLAPAEALPFDDAVVDAVLAQLVLHFVGDPDQAAREFRRVLRPGGRVGACVWDFAGGMEMLRAFWDAALEVDPGAPAEAQTLRFGGPGEMVEQLDSVGFVDLDETVLQVSSPYTGFDELWAGFLYGIGPAGGYLVTLPQEQQDAVREALHRRIGSPAGGFTLGATARCVVGRSPA